MKAIFEIKNKSMIPEPLQPLTDRIGIAITGIAAYMNVKIGFMKIDLNNLLLSPTLSSLLAIIISVLSIFWLLMKIYDQYLTTKLKKEAINGDNRKIKKQRFNFFRKAK